MKNWKRVAILDLGTEPRDLVAINYDELFPAPAVGVQFNLEGGIFRIVEPPTGCIGSNNFDAALLSTYSQYYGTDLSALQGLETLRYVSKSTIVLLNQAKPEFDPSAQLVYIRMKQVQQRSPLFNASGAIETRQPASVQ